MKASLSTIIRIARLAAGQWFVAAVLLCAAGVPAAPPTFTDVTATVAPGLPQAWVNHVTWADFDNDGRLDFFITTSDSISAQLWRNTGNQFTNATDQVRGYLPGNCWVTWVDYDNDGFLDFLMTGPADGDFPTAQLWRNTGGEFTNVTAKVAPGGLPGIISPGAWGDYDNDGRLDLLLAGATDNGDSGYDDLAQLWRNTEHGFTNVTASVVPGLPAVLYSSVAWGDYDNDGRLDFLFIGSYGYGEDTFTQLWHNTGSGFSNVTASVLPGLQQFNFGSVAWADYDNDGRLDFVITGLTNGSSGSGVFQLWRNTGTGFTNVTASVLPDLPQFRYGPVTWADYDNDGRLDFLITGQTGSGNSTGVTQLWRNTGSGFTNVTASVLPNLPQFTYASIAWGDYNNDGRLDLLIGGSTNDSGDGICQLWRNNTPLTNTPPSAPTGLAMTASSNAVMLSWNSAMDDQTPASGLTYNVRAGTTPGGNNLLSAHVNATNGFRRVPAMGNAMLRHSLPLTGLTNGQTVYWSVQAVDTSFAGGPFAAETSVVSLPQLRITRPDTINAVVSWTPPTFGWVLQQSPNVSASNWSITTSGNANPATLPATNGAQFYRLSKP